MYLFQCFWHFDVPLSTYKNIIEVVLKDFSGKRDALQFLRSYWKTYMEKFVSCKSCRLNSLNFALLHICFSRMTSNILTYPYILNSIPEWMLWFSQNRSSLQEEVFLKVPPNSQENTVPEPQACNFIKKETLALMFLCEFGEMFKNTFFIEHLRWLLLPISLKRPFFCWMSLCAGGTKIKIWILINQPSGYVEIEAYFVQFLLRVTSDVKFLHRFFFLIKVI